MVSDAAEAETNRSAAGEIDSAEFADQYVDFSTGLLENLVGVRTQAELDRSERDRDPVP